MSTVFIQLDENYGISFIYSEDMPTLRNLLSTYNKHVKSFGNEEGGTYALSYSTECFQDINSLCSAIFDEVVVLKNDQEDSYGFVEQCKEILNGK